MVGIAILSGNHKLNVRQVPSISREPQFPSIVSSGHTSIPSQSNGARQFSQYIDILREPL